MPYPCQDGVSVTFKIQQWLRKSKKRDTRLSVAEQSILALIPRQVGDRSEGESRARHKSLPRNTAEKAKRRRTRKFPPNVLDTRPAVSPLESSEVPFLASQRSNSVNGRQRLTIAANREAGRFAGTDPTFYTCFWNCIRTLDKGQEATILKMQVAGQIGKLAIYTSRYEGAYEAAVASSLALGNFPDRAGFARPLDTQSGMRRPTPALDLKQHGDAIAGYLPEQTVALLVEACVSMDMGRQLTDGQMIEVVDSSAEWTGRPPMLFADDKTARLDGTGSSFFFSSPR
ncbi:uncharacterized protein BO96DRAFT_434874 [Aspergillus niger CBS 101883]|uniref:uncharacterized protein n=1 Tax=Aspergillus lacticoffeatus (strain CBS 101883) TaxID=1450533 RepID=UPI000D7ED94E|nr:uncharacterized protein BO96DRAFT_434874 [Aspergillus niger CBS 101883]PYH55959.1 hypothetical protein BO96DRAFT_434874 [Aspergillus niger CBS 101883]